MADLRLLDVDALITELSQSEKVALLSGAGACSTLPIGRMNIPSLQTSDGPHGLRGGGGRFFNMPHGYQFPSATAMGATFDVDLMYAAGQLLGREGRRKGVGVALAPTVCLQRSPLLGRGFEAFGEDPLLSGNMAARYTRGTQDCQVGICIKHYVAHDQSAKALEDETFMSQRTLRELHLLPFQIVQRDSKPWAYMAAYQRINGVHVSEDPFLLKEVLRQDWGFDGLVMSDWWGTYSTAEALNAGLDLEMPGPSIWRGKQLMAAVDARKVSPQTIDRAVKNLLNLINKTLNPPKQEGDGEDTPEARAIIRKIAADSIVLLKNEKKVLPLRADDPQATFGLIGELFESPANAGGGSSESTPFYVSSPLDAVTEILGAERVLYEPGCYTRRWTPNIKSGLFLPGSRDPGLHLEWFATDPTEFSTAECVHTDITRHTTMYFSQIAIKNVPEHYYIRIKSTYIAPNTGSYRFALSVCGKAKLWVDGELAVDQWTSQPKKTDDTACFNKLSAEGFFDVNVEKGKQYDLCIVMTNMPLQDIAGPPGAGGVRLGGQLLRDEDEAIKNAVRLAQKVDVPIVIGGLGSDYEYEASDRTHLLLSRRQNEMIRQVCEANPKTVVVIQTGMPIEMPWIDQAHTVVHSWLGGQETGHALADVLFGKVNPSGRLSLTFPKRVEDNPAFLNFGKAERSIFYGEGVFLGYRYYEMLGLPPLFYFGHGLSYTTFELSDLTVPEIFDGGVDGTLTVSVNVANTGMVDGAEVVQVYVADKESSLQRPRKELKAFKKVFLARGEMKRCTFTLDKYALSFWAEEFNQWIAEAGDFEVIISKSADPRDELLRGIFSLPETYLWSGFSGHGSTVNLLLESGKVDHNFKDRRETPLSLAVQRGYTAVAKRLLESDEIHKDLEDYTSRTPLSWAADCGRNELVSLLLESGKVDVDYKDRVRPTPLSYAARQRHGVVVKLLLESGKVDAALEDNDGRTPLSWASSRGWADPVRVLLEPGRADENHGNKDGRTALSYAAQYGQAVVVKLLLGSNKVDPHLADNIGRIPLAWAESHARDIVVDLLLKSGKSIAVLKG